MPDRLSILDGEVTFAAAPPWREHFATGRTFRPAHIALALLRRHHHDNTRTAVDDLSGIGERHG